MPRFTVCAVAGCPELAPARSGRCERHKRKPWSVTSKRNLSRPRRASAQRERILRRDHHRCQWPGCRAKATEVDHVVEVADGGTWSDSNMQSLCAEHHAEKTRHTRAARAARKAG